MAKISGRFSLSLPYVSNAFVGYIKKPSALVVLSGYSCIFAESFIVWAVNRTKAEERRREEKKRIKWKVANENKERKKEGAGKRGEKKSQKGKAQTPYL